MYVCVCISMFVYSILFYTFLLKQTIKGDYTWFISWSIRGGDEERGTCLLIKHMLYVCYIIIIISGTYFYSRIRNTIKA